MDQHYTPNPQSAPTPSYPKFCRRVARRRPMMLLSSWLPRSFAQLVSLVGRPFDDRRCPVYYTTHYYRKSNSSPPKISCAIDCIYLELRNTLILPIRHLLAHHTPRHRILNDIIIIRRLLP